MRKKLLAWTLTILMILMLVPMSNVNAAQSGQTTTLHLSLEYGQTQARTILDMINEMRTSSTDAWYWASDDQTKVTCNNLKELQYDYDLEKIAMERAKEIALSYSHTRPNGEDCFTAYDISWNYIGENIAAGYVDDTSVNKGWREDNENYIGQGHRRNMLDSDFNCVGIGHVYYNGIHYWVEEFANRSSINTTETTANDSKQNVSVEILNSNIEEIEVPLEKDDYCVKVGNRTAVKMSSDSNVIVKVSDHWPSGKAPITDIPQLGVADSSVATYSNGELTGIKEGTTNLTAKLGNKVFYLPSKVSVHDLEKIEAKNATYTKLGNKEYYKCKVCKKLYLDVNGEKETTLKEVTIPVLPKKNQTITGTKSSYTKTYGNAKFSLGAKAKGKLTYKSDKESVATVSQSGVVTIKGAGTAKIKITAAATTEYNSSVKTVTISVKKASPSITIKSVDAKKTISYSKVKKKAQSFQLKVSVNSKAKLTYKKASGNSKFTVGNTGKVTVAKGVKKGSYALKIKVSALAKGNYNAGSKTIKVTVTVK